MCPNQTDQALKTIPMNSTFVFIVPRVADYQQLITGLPADTEYTLLDGESDGISQMAAWLSGWTGLDSIHVIPHSNPGALALGNSVRDEHTLVEYGAELAQIGRALTENGDLLLYGYKATPVVLTRLDKLCPSRAL